MKKLLLIFVFLTSFTSVSFAEKEQQQSVDSTSLYIYKDIKSTIAAMAESLQVPTKHVYSVLVKQQTIDAWMYLVIFVVSLVICYFSLVAFDKSNDEDPESMRDFFGWITVVMLIIAAGTLIFHSDDIFSGFFNPEYGAIQEIMDFVKAD